MVLADVYAQDGRFDRSRVLIEELIGRYPSSRFMLWSRARHAEERRDFASAAGDYQRLAEAYQPIAGARRSAASTQYNRARVLMLAGDTRGAREACERILTLYGARKEPFFRELVRDTRRLKERIERNG
jgi:tetratricopeptide (TPR) repeat protein